MHLKRSRTRCDSSPWPNTKWTKIKTRTPWKSNPKTNNKRKINGKCTKITSSYRLYSKYLGFGAHLIHKKNRKYVSVHSPFVSLNHLRTLYATFYNRTNVLNKWRHSFNLIRLNICMKSIRNGSIHAEFKTQYSHQTKLLH